MKEIKIQVPDGYELKQVSEGKWELIEEKKVTLEQLLKVTHPASITTPFDNRNISFGTIDQLNRVEAMLKLMCVADYLNDGWEPNWNDNELIWHIEWCGNNENKLLVEWSCVYSTRGEVVFKTRDLAKRAIEICGEELIKTALGV